MRNATFGAVLLTGAALFLSACATKNSPSASSKKQAFLNEDANPIILPEEYEAQERGDVPKFDIPVVRNAKVEQWISYFQGRGAKWYRIWLERSGRYIPMMKKILRDHGLPEDLVYLAMIESGFSSKAYSRARAVGPWQFMKATGRRYNLSVDFWADERRDPEKATIAAARHLKDLYDQFQSWKLAAAAYNAGAGKVERAIRKYRTEDFWELAKYRYLRPETRHYVPKLIAAALIAKTPEDYGFSDIQFQDPLSYERIVLTSQVDLFVLAQKSGTPAADLLDLNPELNHPITPPTSQYELRVPAGTSERYLNAFNSLDPSERFRAAVHVVRRGDTLGQIARAYGVPADEIMKLNRIRSSKSLRVGSSLILPVSDSARAARKKGKTVSVAEQSSPREESMGSTKSERTVTPAVETATTEEGRPKIHVVRRGESLWDIAQRYGISVQEIKSENNLRKNRIFPGRRLVIPST